MTDLELALKQRDEARAELEKVKKSNMHLVIENAQLKLKAKTFDVIREYMTRDSQHINIMADIFSDEEQFDIIQRALEVDNE